MFLIGVALIAGVFYWAGFYEAIGLILNIPIKYLLILLLIQFIIILISTIKWRVVLRGSKVSFLNLFSATLMGYLVNNITPVGMAGGEPVRAYALHKTDKISIEKSFASVIVDLFLEIFPLFILIMISIFLIMGYGVTSWIMLFLGFVGIIIFLLFVVSITLVINKEFSLRIVNLFVGIMGYIPLLKKKSLNAKMEIDELCTRFSSAMRENMTDYSMLISGTIISIVKWFLIMVRVYVIFLALSIPITFDKVIIVETTVIAISAIPLLPGALGIWEGSSIALFVLFNVPKASAGAVTLLDRIFHYLIPSILGIFSALFLGVSISQLMREKNKRD